MSKINYSDDLRAQWAKNDGDRDTLVAKTALAAVMADAEITAKAFIESTREAGFQAAGAVFQAALKCAKDGGSTEAGVAQAAKTAREKIAADSREKRRKAKEGAEAKAKAKAELEELKEKALTNKELAVELVERNLTAENELLIELEREQMRLTLLVNKSRRVLENAGHNLCPPILNWTPAGMVDLVECRELAALAKPEIEAWWTNAILRKGKLEASGKDSSEVREFVDKCEGWLEIVEENRASLAGANK